MLDNGLQKLDIYIETVRSKVRRAPDKQLWRNIQKVGFKLFRNCNKKCSVVNEQIRHRKKCDKLFEAFRLLTNEEARRSIYGSTNRDIDRTIHMKKGLETPKLVTDGGGFPIV